MKKLLLFCALVACMVTSALPTAQAQTPAVTGQFYSTTGRATAGLILDTATNTTTISQYGIITGFQDYVGISVAVTKLTGTVGGKVLLYANNKVGFTREKIAVDSLVVGNVTPQQTLTFKLASNQFTNYETRYIPTGTQTSTLQTYWITRKRPIK